MTNTFYLNPAQLKAELNKCLNCAKKPCLNSCPVNCNPAEFIALAFAGKWEEAGLAILRMNPLGQTCGLVCPDHFCMRSCTRGNIDFPIRIPKVQATILEKVRKNQKLRSRNQAKLNGKRIAVIGAGPAGMSAAAVLAGLGYSVTLFESSSKIGGAANLIPEMRLPYEVIEKDWNFIKSLGDIDLKLMTTVENPLELLKDNYEGVVIATGEPFSVQLGIEGENHVVGYMDYLRTPEKYQVDGNVAIIGGGSVATDCAFTAKQMGAANVEMFVRRRISDMRISNDEHRLLMENSIDITSMTRVNAVLKKKSLFTVETCKTRFNNGKLEDISGTLIKRPDFSLVIMAIGSKSEQKINHERVLYAGDCKNGSSTIVEAVASGKNAGNDLHRLICGESAASCEGRGEIKSSVFLQVV